MPVSTSGVATGQPIAAAHHLAVATLLNDLEVTVGNLSGGGSAQLPFYIRPPSTSTDIGPLINSALNVYGAALVAPCPDPSTPWACSTPIQIGTSETLIGFGHKAAHIRATTSFPTTSPLVTNRTGGAAGFTISDLLLNANGRGTNSVGLNYTSATGPEGGALTAPDPVPTIERVHAHGATGDGVYVGGSNAYDGNFREARVRWLLATGYGGWGLTCASSDMFVSDVTCHASGGDGGIRGMANMSGNLKLMHCKGYFLPIGIQINGARGTIFGGEVQDCNVGIHLNNSDAMVSTFIDSCGDGSNGALKIGGSGHTFAVGMTSRTLASQPSTMEYALQFMTNTGVYGGFINTNTQTGKYTNRYLGANRPAAASTINIDGDTTWP